MNESNYIPKESQNCPINVFRLNELEDVVKDMKCDLKYIKEDNEVQNELLAKFDTMIEYMISNNNDLKEERRIDRLEQKEVTKESITTLKAISDNLITLNLDMDNVKSEINSLKIAKNDRIKNENINVISLLNSTFTKVMAGILLGGATIGVIYWVSNLN